MMISFDYLTKPIDFSQNNINVLCIENKNLFRNVLSAFYNEDIEQLNMVFSENYEPFQFKKNVCFINDYYKLTYSSAIIKKLYNQISNFCNEELLQETLNLKSTIISFLDLVNKNFDYDFSYSLDFNLQDLFKIQLLTPLVENDSLLSTLLEFILIINKYVKPKLFILLNLHLYFSNEELKDFFKEIKYNNINILTLENQTNFEISDYENVIIIDNDLCEIIEN